ncbi:MAG: YbbR-like protein [Mucilaginibacter sp.]|nr:YbbR-like protein [Mucilaginibacter sp.]
MAIIKLSATERRRVSAFLTCLVVAAVAWIIVTLSNSYNFTVQRVLTFKNVPQKRAFHSLQPDTVNVNVRGNGWQMLLSRMNDENKSLTVDLRSLEKENYIVLSSQLASINESQGVNNRIIAVNPDTLYFDFSNRSTKKVPVRVMASINFEHGFAQSDNISIKPAYITLSGPSNRIDKITSWKTDSLILNDVDETVISQLNLEPAKEGNISTYPKSVKVTVPVSEFTEKTIEVPVKLINNSNYFNVKVFPQKVKVTFATSLNKYTEMDEDLFEAVADLNMWKKYSYSVLPVMLTKLPEFCRIVKIEPKNIDFIIKK